MLVRRAVLVMVLAASLVGAAPPHPAASKPADGSTSQLQATIKQMAEAQKWQGEQLWHVKEQVEALPGIIAEAKEGHTATQEEVGKLRDEVKGLYVDISTVKQQIDALKGDIDAVNGNVSGFRTYSGFFLALMILMVFVILAMTIRR